MTNCLEGKFMNGSAENKVYDVIVCGGGPAGVTAAIYAKRYGLDILLIERLFIGGQAATTPSIENYPGYADGISGAEFAMSLSSQLQSMGVPIENAAITAFGLDGNVKSVYTSGLTYRARSVILAMGAEPKKLGVPGEEKFRGRGVSYCATCDGAFYRGKTAVVVGGGNTAAEDCIFLCRLCKKVYLIHRRDKLRAHGYLCDKIKELGNAEIIYNAELREILGGDDGKVRGAVIDVKAEGERIIDTDAVFIAVGTVPQTSTLDGLPENENGYILTDGSMRCSTEHVYAAGDVRKKGLRQIVTAAADGAVAAQTAAEDLISGQSAAERKKD